MIPSFINIKNGELPDEPGVYFYFDRDGNLLYVGKATSLKRRVGSYFRPPATPSSSPFGRGRIQTMVGQIARIDYIETGTVIEALVLEANQIKALKPKYNILQRDDKTYLYLVITRETFPKPLLMRGQDLERLGVNPFAKKLEGKAKEKFLAVFGPYTSGTSLRKALDLVRKAIPWSDCDPPANSNNPSKPPLRKGRMRLIPKTQRPKPCFNVGVKKCPGVCIGAISKTDYRKIIRQLILFFQGKKSQLVRQMKKEMDAASKAMDFERAARLRNSVYALEHIQDVALITKDESQLPATNYQLPATFLDLNGRIEAYDISNISGTSAVGSMVVFEGGKPAKSLYRKFKIKTVEGSDDFAMMEEVLRRRLAHTSWPLPQLMVIDGGEGQVARVQRVISEVLGSAPATSYQLPSTNYKLPTSIPLIGLAKGFDRKQDRLVYDVTDKELSRVAIAGKELFQRARDEAHRFAVAYHRVVRGKRFLGASL